MNNNKKLEELINTRAMIESDEFQKYFVKPIREEINKLKMNFFSDTLKDAWRKGGKVEGLQVFFNILKQIDTDYKNEQFENSSK